MKIETVEIYPITMALRTPIPMASGVIETSGNVVVKVVTSEGLVGWGEGVEAPTLTHQRQADIVADLETLRPLIVGSDPMRRTELWLQMSAALPGSSTAIGAIDIAVHDLAAKAIGVPVHQLLGGKVRDKVPALTLVGSGDAGADADKLAERYEQGFRWFKIKLGMASCEVEVGTVAKSGRDSRRTGCRLRRCERGLGRGNSTVVSAPARGDERAIHRAARVPDRSRRLAPSCRALPGRPVRR